ncbi:MAG: hypothetical protein ABIF08_03935 [Nanoarchaeota archaeon]
MSHETTTCRITKAKWKLRRLDPDNPLLPLIIVYDYYITQTKEFGIRYHGFDSDLALDVYATDLEEEFRKEKKKLGKKKIKEYYL